MIRGERERGGGRERGRERERKRESNWTMFARTDRFSSQTDRLSARVCLSDLLPVCPFACLSNTRAHPLTCLPVCLMHCLSVLTACDLLSVTACLSVCLSVNHTHPLTHPLLACQSVRCPACRCLLPVTCRHPSRVRLRAGRASAYVPVRSPPPRSLPAPSPAIGPDETWSPGQ